MKQPSTTDVLRSGRLTLRAWLLVVLGILAAVPCLFLGYREGAAAYNAESSRSDRERRLAAKAVSREVERWIEGPLHATAVVAEAVRTKGADPKALESVLATQREQLPSVLTCFFTDANGVVVVASPKLDTNGRSLVGVGYGDRPYVAPLKATLKPVVAALERSRSTGHPVVAVATPILNERREYDGMSVCSIDMTRVQTLIDRVLDGTETLRVTVLENQGRAIVHWNPEKRGTLPSMNEYPLFAPALDDASTYTRAGLDDSGTEVRASVLGLRTSFLNWTIIIAEPAEISRAHVYAALKETLRTALLAFVVALLAAFALARLLARPFESVLRVTEAVERGRLDVMPPAPHPLEAHEIARLLRSTESMVKSLRSHSVELGNVTGTIDRAIGRIRRTGESVAVGSSETNAAIRETSTSIDAIIQSLRTVASNAEELSAGAQQSQMSLVAMGGVNREMVGKVHSLATSVDTSAKGIERQIEGVGRVAADTDAASLTVEEASNRVANVDASLAIVERTAREATSYSTAAATDAEHGAFAVKRAIEGIERIRDASRVAGSAMSDLDTNIEDVARVVGVIDQIAEQTNLLALNATILAAQAGEAGRGFAVVAEEIRRLADRTASSTREIAEMIARVQTGSQRAIQAVTEGETSVALGVDLGSEAAEALAKIVDSANRATHHTQAIASATIEQAQETRLVSEGMRDLSTRMRSIASATSVQSRESQDLASQVRRMRELTRDVEATAAQQAHRFEDLSRATERMISLVSSVGLAQQKQGKEAEAIFQVFESILRVAEEQRLSSEELGRVIETLSSESKVLAREVGRFRVGEG